MRLLTWVAALLLAACSSAPKAQAPAAANAAAPAAVAASASNGAPTIRFEQVALSPPRASFNNSYVRLALLAPTATQGTSASAQESFFKTAASNLRRYFWDKKQVLTMIAKPINLRSGIDTPAVQLFQTKTENGKEVSTDLQPMVISPYSTDIDPGLTVQLKIARAETVDSKVASAAAEAFKFASTFASGGVLGKLAGKDFSDEAKRLDNVIGELLKAGQVDPFNIPMNLLATERLDLFAEGGGTRELLFSIKFDTRQTLIGTTELASSIPTEPADITKVSIISGKTTSTIRAAMAPNIAGMASKPADPQEYQSFCTSAPGMLADLGLNRYDRAAVIYAFLRDSTWNRSLSVRQLPDEDDQCLIATKDLAANTSLKLSSRNELSREAGGLRDAWLAKYKLLWEKPLPVALQTKDAAAWSNVLADSVSISVAGAPFRLSAASEPLEAGAGFTVNKAEAADALSTSDLAFTKSGFCFRLDSTSKANIFVTPCLKLVAGDASKAVKVEFSIDPTYDPTKDQAMPKISGIRFISS